MDLSQGASWVIVAMVVVMVVVIVVVASACVLVWACGRGCGRARVVVWCGGAIPTVSTTATFTKEFSLCAWMCVWVWVCGGASLEVEARLWRWRRVAGGGRASLHLAGSGKCRRCVRARGACVCDSARAHTCGVSACLPRGAACVCDSARAHTCGVSACLPRGASL